MEEIFEEYVTFHVSLASCNPCPGNHLYYDQDECGKSK